MRELLQVEPERSAGLGIIEKIDEPTEWTSPMIVARKRDGKMRICIDPQALNKAFKRSVHPVPTVEQLLPDLFQAKVIARNAMTQTQRLLVTFYFFSVDRFV